MISHSRSIADDFCLFSTVFRFACLLPFTSTTFVSSRFSSDYLYLCFLPPPCKVCYLPIPILSFLTWYTFKHITCIFIGLSRLPQSVLSPSDYIRFHPIPQLQFSTSNYFWYQLCLFQLYLFLTFFSSAYDQSHFLFVIVISIASIYILCSFVNTYLFFVLIICLIISYCLCFKLLASLITSPLIHFRHQTFPDAAAGH